MSTLNNKITGSLYQIVDYDETLGNIRGLNLTYLAGNTELGSNTNVKLTGGSSGQVLTTDGTGNLSWSTPISGNLSILLNSSNIVYIPTSNGSLNLLLNDGNTILIPV